MENLNLKSILSATGVPPESKEGDLHVVQIPQFNNHLFGFNHDKHPCLVIKCIDANKKDILTLEGVKIIYDEKYGIYDENNQTNSNYTTITCLSEDSLVHLYFSHLCESMLKIIGNKPKSAEVNKALDHIINLLQKLRQPGIKDIKGLIGELVFILYSNNVKDAVKIWRNKLNDNYDFYTNDIALEVKTCSSSKREHYISYEQTNPPKTLTAILVSIYIELAKENEESMSLQDLILGIKSKLNDDTELIKKFEDNISATLGKEIIKSFNYSFNKELAINNIQLYDILLIPAIRGILPDGVSKVKFKSDLTDISTLENNDIEISEEIKDLIKPFMKN